MLHLFRFECPAKNCELDPSDMEGATAIIENLLIGALYLHFPSMIMQPVDVQYYQYSARYILRVPAWINDALSAGFANLEEQVEGVLSEALLEIFPDGVYIFW